MNVLHTKQPLHIEPRAVWYTGSDGLERGQSVSFDRDTGTAADADGRRDKYVEKTSNSNNEHYAGVVMKKYRAKTGGQPIKIWEPPCVCRVLSLVDTVVGVTRLTALAGGGFPGAMYNAGFKGKGSMLALQTVTVQVSTECDDGTVSVSTKTLTDDDSADSFDGVSVGDKVIILGGDGDTITPGIYTVTAVTDTNNIVVDDAPGDGQINCLVISPESNGEYPVVLALLDGGPQSGMCEVISAVSGAAAQSMVGGVTFIAGGYAVATNSTCTLADGLNYGDKKAFVTLGAITTADYVVTVTSGIRLDKSTGLSTLTFNAAAENAELHWFQAGGIWLNIWSSGVTEG